MARILILLRIGSVVAAMCAFSKRSVSHAEKLRAQEAWVECTYNMLTDTERIAQLFFIEAYSGKDTAHHEAVEAAVKRYGVGGIIFFQGTAERQIALTNRLQQTSKVPLLMAMDAEWGLGMRLTDAISFPKAMSLGALSKTDLSLVREMGQEMARQMRSIGIHINFAPVLDINSNPKNPVIGIRSFGEEPAQVSERGLLYVEGLTQGGVMAVGKHFPGHGDTAQDSHRVLPTVSHPTARLEAVELRPFRDAIRAGMPGVMVGHLRTTAYPSAQRLPCSLSKEVVTDLLQKQMDFRGLVFTDALNMQAVLQSATPQEAALKALQAGHDVLVFPSHLPGAIERVAQALDKGELDKTQWAQKVKRVLRLKYRMGLAQWTPIDVMQALGNVVSPQAQRICRGLFEKAVTVVANHDQRIPVRNVDTTETPFVVLSMARRHAKAVVALEPARLYGIDETNPKKPGDVFFETVQTYASAVHHRITFEELAQTDVAKLIELLKGYKMVIVDLHDLPSGGKAAFNMAEQTARLLKSLDRHVPTVVAAFGNPYALRPFCGLKHVLISYEDNTATENIVPQVLFGALSATGRLPVTIAPGWNAGDGVDTKTLQRIGYTLPEAVGMDSAVLKRIDDLVKEAIALKATPGCQVTVARGGKVVFEKNYGYQTYKQRRPITADTFYDVASVTKVAGTVQALMYLVGQHRLQLHKPLAYYLPVLRHTNKSNLRIKDVLTHRSGLHAYLWQALSGEVACEKGGLNPCFFADKPSELYPNRIGEKLYGSACLEDLVWQSCLRSHVHAKKSWWHRKHSYRYSCVGFLLMQRLVEKMVGEPIDRFLENQFYRPLGVRCRYRPLTSVDVASIAPAGYDPILGSRMAHGVVHDPLSALCGGVAGNAGLFCRARDLTVLLQMNLQDGSYGGRRYLAPGVMRRFAATQPGQVPRGLGWDKPTLPDKIDGVDVSRLACGHNGFTGTAAWIDPNHCLLYVFLSNRTWPSQANKTLARRDTRRNIHVLLYEAIASFQRNQ